MKNKELRAWVILLAWQLTWIVPLTYDYMQKQPTEDELICEYEDVLRFRIDEIDEVSIEELEIEIVEKTPLTSLGEFRITAYCPCEEVCSGKWGYQTSTGAIATEGRTIAVDPTVIPYGTTVVLIIDGQEYEFVSEDCGSAIKGKRIDVFFESHQRAREFGVKYGEIFIKESN